MLFGPVEKNTFRPVVKESLMPGDFTEALPYLQYWQPRGINKYWKNPKTREIELRPEASEIRFRK